MSNKNFAEETNGEEAQEEETGVSEQNDEAEVEEDNMIGITLTCPTDVLAAQIRKVMPSANITNKKSSLTVMDDDLFNENRTSNSTMKKRITFASSSNINSVSSEINMEEVLEPNEDTKVIKVKKVDSIIRSFPVPLEEKRTRRNTIMPKTRKPWNEKVKDYFSGLAGKLPHFKLWHEDLKVIEGQCGASVVSYFVFIRWLLLMDLIILFLNAFFLVLPQFTFLPVRIQIEANLTFNETITGNFSLTKVLRNKAFDDELSHSAELNSNDDTRTVLLSGAEESWPQFEAWDEAALNNCNSSVDLIEYCRLRYISEVENVTTSGIFAHLQNFLQGTGWFERSAWLFIGSYPIEQVFFFGQIYYMPLAVIWVLVVSFGISLIMMVQYASVGIQEAFKTHEAFEDFSNKIFCSWDYCIRSADAAKLHRDKFVKELKTNLSEARLRKEIGERTTAQWIQIYCKRIFVYFIVIVLIGLCYTGIYYVALFQLQEFKTNQLQEAGLKTLLIQFLPSITCVVINFFAPFVFDLLVPFEQYDFRKKVNVCLARNNFISLSSIIVLVFTFHQQIVCKPRDICGAGGSYECRTPRCWETYVGQQLYKLNLMHLFVIIGVFLFHDLPRDYVVKNYDNKYTRLIGRSSFYLPVEVLDPIYAQSVLWLGVFYSPLLPIATVILLIILFYTKKAKALKLSEPSKTLYKTSRFNSAFMNILVMCYFVILTVHFYTLVQIRPSLGCSPFRIYNSMMDALRRAFQFLPFDLITVFTFIFSGWFFVLASILMCVIIYYYWKYISFLKDLELSLTADLHLLNQDKQFLLKNLKKKFE